MEQLLLLASPFVVALVTQGVKWLLDKLSSFGSEGSFRYVILRFLVAIFSFATVIGGAALAGHEVDTVSIQTFVDSALVFIAATGVYFFGKRK